jgi:hypothetical protein
MIRRKAGDSAGPLLPDLRAKIVRLFVIVATVLLFGGCSLGRAEETLPASPPEIVVEMYEYEYRYNIQQPIPAGRVVFRFVNGGDEVHRPVLLPLTDEVPPILEQVRGDVRAAATPFAGVPPRGPDQTGTFAVDLMPGQRYALICFARTADNRSHAVLGMASDLRAEDPPASEAGE